jgi:predicted DNA-binding protein YlxM (UPF0122 family)
MSVKDSEWIPDKEFNIMEATVKKVLANMKIMSMVQQLCLEEYMENTDNLTAQQIIDLIRDFLKNNHNEISAYVFLNFLAYYPKSMTSYNLTPLMQRLIAFTYYYCQNDKEAPKLSMEELAEWFRRSKSTIYDAIQKHGELEQILKAELEEDRLRAKAQKEAYKQLIEEEKQKLKLERENNQKDKQKSEQTLS